MNRWTWIFVTILFAASTLPSISKRDDGVRMQNTNMDVKTTAHLRVTPVNP